MTDRILVSSGSAVATFADIGTNSAVTGITPVKVDLASYIGAKRSGLLMINVKTTNGQGGTPTSPGSGKKFYLRAAFSEDGGLSAADAPTVLQTKQLTVECALPNTDQSTVAGQRHYEGSPFVITGRYLFLWGDHDALASANAKIDGSVTAQIV